MPDAPSCALPAPGCPCCGKPLDRSPRKTGRGVYCENCELMLSRHDSDEQAMAAEHVEFIREELPKLEDLVRVWGFVLAAAEYAEPREEPKGEDDGCLPLHP